jgi:predicted Fe-Mo cluster-binding NifX family protein
MKIAVSIDKEGFIAPHLGKCKLFQIFIKEGDQIKFQEERETEGNHQNHIIDEIMDCDCVISAQIGDGMIENLKSLGIKPIVENVVLDPFEAVKVLEIG